MTSPNCVFVSTHFLPIVLCFVLVILGTLTPSVRSDLACSEALGDCNGDCDVQCRSRHPGQQASGTCDVTIARPVCMCYYDCGPDPPRPPKRECTAGLGFCTTECNEACCGSKCSSQYNLGVGTCDSTGIGPILCSCHYECH